jgi:DNA-binding response OmpR family regulator
MGSLDTKPRRPAGGLPGRGISTRGVVQQKSHILVVEPDDLILGLLERWLGEAGYPVVVETWQKLPEAVDEADRPQLVIVDVPTPRSAGEIIKSLEAVYASPILLLSARFRRGLGSSSDVARELGVRNILPKPFTRGELLSAVADSIDAE